MQIRRTGGACEEPAVDSDEGTPKQEDSVVDKALIMVQRLDAERGTED